MRELLPRLFFEHFNDTSFAVGPSGVVHAFLVGFLSQSQPGVAYIHFVGVSPERRGEGLGRRLYERFFESVQARGSSFVRCITSPLNTGSIGFHRRMGFDVLPGTGEIDGLAVALHHGGEGQHRVVFQKVLALPA